MDPVKEQERLQAARLYAEWHIGDRAWADEILWAYHNPQEAIEMVRGERAD